MFSKLQHHHEGAYLAGALLTCVRQWTNTVVTIDAVQTGALVQAGAGQTLVHINLTVNT